MSDTSPSEQNLTGIPKEFPEAAAKLATFGVTLVTEVSNLARYIGRIVGTVPEDAVGFIIGNPLHAARSLQGAWLDTKVQEILNRRRAAQTEPVSLSVAIPLIQAAYDESRPGLREMWAELIANAMDPERSGRVRLSFIETLKQFDPMDAVVLKARNDWPDSSANPNIAQPIADQLGIPFEEVMISVENLKTLKCMQTVNSWTNIFVTTYGRGLLRACTE